jgi:hypothetical protein
MTHCDFTKLQGFHEMYRSLNRIVNIPHERVGQQHCYLLYVILILYYLELEGCEDLAIHHRSGQVFLACGNVATRRAQLESSTYAINVNDSLSSYDLEVYHYHKIPFSDIYIEYRPTI